MTQDEKWQKNYDEVMVFMDTHHRNPSKHKEDERLKVNWLKHQRKLMNRGDLCPDRLERFNVLLARAERLKRVNQWQEEVEEILQNDVLRNHQQEMLGRLQDAWKQHKSVMVQMPTGTGKTVLMAEVIRQHSDSGVLVVAHRRELIAQISQTLEGFGVDHGLIVSGQEIVLSQKVQVASIQTLSRRIDTLCFLPALVIIDEAHHALADTYRLLWDKCPKAKFLGLTATPCRLNNAPFTDLFDTLLQSWSIRDFIKKGWLSDLDYISVRSNSSAVRKVATLNKRSAGGDFQEAQMALVLDTEESIRHLYESYHEYADSKKGIVYAINRDHAQHIAAYYQHQGISCAAIDFKTPPMERQRLVEAYRNDELKILVGCQIFSEGFDCPEVEVIQLARPTLSLSLYLQQVGRGMRISKGKNEVIILDQVGSYLIFGLPTSDRNWQAMFYGKASGKGNLRSVQKGYTRSEGADRVLVNEEMVRIKSIVTGQPLKEKEQDEKKVVRTRRSFEQEMQESFYKRDYEQHRKKYCEAVAAWILGAAREHKRILALTAPFTDKVFLTDRLATRPIYWAPFITNINARRLLVVVNREHQVAAVFSRLSWVRRDCGVFSGACNSNLRQLHTVVCSQERIRDSFLNLAMSYTPDLIVIWDGNTADPWVFDTPCRTWSRAWVVGYSSAPCDVRTSPTMKMFTTLQPSTDVLADIVSMWHKKVELIAAPYNDVTAMCLKNLKPRQNPENFVTTEAYRMLDRRENIVHIYKSYMKYAKGRRGLIFAMDSTVASEIMYYFARMGEKVCKLKDHIPTSVEVFVDEFASGRYDVVVVPCNYLRYCCDYEFPEIEFVQLTYPTQLLSEYLGMVNVGIKSKACFPEKYRSKGDDDRLLVIDHSTMSDTYGHPSDMRDWNTLFEERQLMIPTKDAFQRYFE